MDLSQISILAIILAVVANMIIGALWYSPLLFANVWMKSLGKTREELHASNPISDTDLRHLPALSRQSFYR